MRLAAAGIVVALVLTWIAFGPWPAVDAAIGSFLYAPRGTISLVGLVGLVLFDRMVVTPILRALARRRAERRKA